MKTTGEISDKKIIVTKSKEVGRLYNKSGIGTPIAGNKLQLGLIDALFLLSEEKIKIFEKGREVSFGELVKLASRNIPRFEMKYLVFRDLRKRGHAVRLCKEKGFDFFIEKDERRIVVCNFSERDKMDISKIRDIIEMSDKRGAELWFAIVDEEGDLTYYDVSIIEPKGKIKEHKFAKAVGIFLENRVILFDEKISKKLFESEFFGKPFGKGLQLSMVEAIYLMDKKVIELVDTETGKKTPKKKFEEVVWKLQPDIQLRTLVFNDLKKRGLIVKTGFKFGTHFRAYIKKPDETHAEYLVHAVDKDFKSIWAEISRAVRLAHSVNKEILFARVGKNIDYIKLGRLRP